MGSALFIGANWEGGLAVTPTKNLGHKKLYCNGLLPFNIFNPPPPKSKVEIAPVVLLNLETQNVPSLFFSISYIKAQI